MRFSFSLALLSLLLAAPGLAQGNDPGGPRVWAITGARLVVSPGKVLAAGAIVLRDGHIEAVGEKIKIPTDATVIDGKGWTLYPGLVNASSRVGMPAELDRPERGDRYPIFAIRPENAGSSLLKLEKDTLTAYRNAGFGVTLAAPGAGLVMGTSAVIELGTDLNPASLMLRPTFAMHAQPGNGGGFREYPGSAMGQIAALRQALSDARFAASQLDAYEKNPTGKKRPTVSRALLALRPVLEKKIPLVVRASGAREIERALALGREFGLTPVIDGGAESYRVIDKLKASKATVFLSLDSLAPPNLGAGGPQNNNDKPTLQSLRARAQAPTSAAQLQKAGVPFALTTDRPDGMLKNARRAIAAGLSETDALAALTSTPAKLLGIEREAGTLEPGKLANLIAVEGDSLFSPKAKLKKVFVDGDPVVLPASGDKLPAAAPGKSDPAIDIKKLLPPGVTPEMALQFLKADPDAAKPFLPAGVTPEQAIAALEGKPALQPSSGGGEGGSSDAIAAPPAVGAGLVPPLPPALPASFVIRGATVWTSGPAGVLSNADVYVRAGKVVAVGKSLKVPGGTLELSGAGKHVTPGMIDCHSHTAVSGGVNEGSNIVTAECRIQDVLNPDDVNIYRQLAGGTTAANVLHGSANAIGGQNATVKWRWGSDADGLLVQGAPQGIKFALGENPTRSNGDFPSDREPRYPISRMGVERVIRARFLAARDYRRKQRAGESIRTDFQLEALAEILEGKRLVHCHSYRADEILMMIRVADDFGFKIATFQHVLEGYKVADELAAHGAGGSTFADWWGYKIEAYDAIPQNGALMTRRGVTVSFNSDDNELARRLNQDAAKAVRWGNLAPEEALKLITINPAKQLRIDKLTGSLEPGKDADLVLWSGDPLSPLSIAEKTFVDGKLYFDREADLAARKELDAERERLTLALNPKPASPPNLGAGGQEKAGGQKTAEASQDNGPRAMVSKNPPSLPNPSDPVTALVGATLHPVSGPAVANGVVLIQSGRIISVGSADTVAIPEGASRVELAGKHLWPGLFDGNTSVGVNEIGSRRETQDNAEQGTFQPELKLAHVINPDAETLRVARTEGVLASFLMPGGGTISGMAALIQLDGWTWEEMTLNPQAGLPVTLPGPGGGRRFGESSHLDDAEDALWRAGRQAPVAPMAPATDSDAALQPLNDFLDEARRYKKAREAEKAGAPAHDIDPKLEAMLPVLSGEVPLCIRADSKKQIETAVGWAKKQGFPLIIVGGSQADESAELLVKENVPVLLGHVLELPRRLDAPYDDVFTLPGRLAKAGVRFALTSNGDNEKVRNLAHHAAMAAAFGLSKDDALKAITLWPAQILGVDHRLGSLEVGKDATLFVTDGDVLELKSQVLAAWVQGKPLDRTSRQSILYARWQARPKK
jgi:imidazolonepropionase-like amidohydrolase